MIGIIDCAAGNLRSVEKALQYLGQQVAILSSPDRVSSMNGLVLPGVGAFGRAMSNLRDRQLALNQSGSGLDGVILDHIKAGKPFLGICLGLQVLLASSEESPSAVGLNIVAGKVVRFPNQSASDNEAKSPILLRVPHMGWNQVQVVKDTPLTQGLGRTWSAYFMHSYYGLPEDETWVAGVTEHGIKFPSILAKDNVFACQFHPEKSGETGLRILSNFARMI